MMVGRSGECAGKAALGLQKLGMLIVVNISPWVRNDYHVP